MTNQNGPDNRTQRLREVTTNFIIRRIANAIRKIMSLNNKHLVTGPEGNSEFCFPRISMFPETKSRETLRLEGNKIHCFPRDQSLSDLLYSKTKQKQILKNALGVLRQNQATFICTLWSRATASGQHFAGNSELFPVWRHSFRNVARSGHLAGNSFIVTMN